jgi:Xaa-Pro aminopeptidase
MARRALDAALFLRPSDVRYFTGFTGEDALLLVAPGRAALFTDGRFAEQAASEVDGAETVIVPSRLRGARAGLRKIRPRRVAFGGDDLSVAAHRFLAKGCPGAAWISAPDLASSLRAVKEPREVREIEAAAAAASQALLSVLSGGTAGKTEALLAAELEFAMRTLGADGPSFPTIVAAGERSSLPHAVPGERIAGEGEPLLVDFGARVRGYCSDETVTLLPPRPTRELRRVYDAVLKAQEAGIAAIRPGTPCRDVDRAVRESLDRAGYLKYFVHSTGHGVGLDIHEAPALAPRSRDRLREGMVVTVEPGIYLPGKGGVRLEDTVYVSASRAERITYLPKGAGALP